MTLKARLATPRNVKLATIYFILIFFFIFEWHTRSTANIDVQVTTRAALCLKPVAHSKTARKQLNEDTASKCASRAKQVEGVRFEVRTATQRARA